MMTARPKLLRDPIHNIIAFDTRDPVDRVLWQLICTSTVQRLRRIRQLGLANLVYHGAEHSRFAHSLGVVHVARRILESLVRQGAPISEEDRLEVLCAALLHDIGHGPFSHAIEQVTGVNHEHYTEALIQTPGEEVHDLLVSLDPSLPGRIVRYFGPREDFPRERLMLLDIVSSQLDADRLDYILRDGQATGVKIGMYDFDRILTMLEVYEGHDPSGRLTRRLAVSYRAREAVEGYLIARFHMYKQVYLHKAVRASEKMLEAVLQRAHALALDDALETCHMAQALSKLLRGEALDARQLLSLDDVDVWCELKRWRTHDDPTLRTLAIGLLDRDLYKTVELDRQDPVRVARTIDRAQTIARDAGLDPTLTVLVDRAQNTPYKPYDPKRGQGGQSIPIIDPDGQAWPIEDRSDLIHLLGVDSYKTWRLCLPGPLRATLLATEPGL